MKHTPGHTQNGYLRNLPVPQHSDLCRGSREKEHCGVHPQQNGSGGHGQARRVGSVTQSSCGGPGALQIRRWPCRAMHTPHTSLTQGVERGKKCLLPERQKGCRFGLAWQVLLMCRSGSMDPSMRLPAVLGVALALLAQAVSGQSPSVTTPPPANLTEWNYNIVQDW